jgi:hypothetical protein
MDLFDKRLEILDDIFLIELTVDDLRRILKVFEFVKYQMELDGEMYLDCYDKELQNRLERKYCILLKKGNLNFL